MGIGPRDNSRIAKGVFHSLDVVWTMRLAFLSFRLSVHYLTLFMYPNELLTANSGSFFMRYIRVKQRNLSATLKNRYSRQSFNITSTTGWTDKLGALLFLIHATKGLRQFLSHDAHIVKMSPIISRFVFSFGATIRNIMWYSTDNCCTN
jgi:hypothetical protein